MATNSKKFSLTELLNQRSKEAALQGQQNAMAKEKDTETVTTADIDDLLPSRDNFYSVEDVQDLKRSIELLGVLQPLLVTDEEDGKQRIIAGHRRRLAVMQLVKEGKERFRYVPIIVKQTKNAILDRLALIMTNRFREKTDWEKMTESIETEKLVQELKTQMDIPGRTRDLLAEIIDASPATLGRYKAIYNNLAAELMAEFKAGKIGVSVIYEISQMEKEWQLRTLEVFREKGTLALPDIKEIKRQQEAAAQVPGQINFDRMAAGQRDTQEITQTDETAAENTKEPQEELCATCAHNGECAGKKTHDSGCMGYESPEDFIDQPEEDKGCEEAKKTDKPRHDEKKEKIDVKDEAKFKVQQETTIQRRTEKKKHKEIRLSPRRYNEITSGTLSFLPLKKDDFKVGEELLLLEYRDEWKTGKTIKIEISYVMEDGKGLDDDYCIIGFQVLSYTLLADGADQPTLLLGA